MRLQPGFEWHVAWRHLRDPKHRSGRLLRFSLWLLGISSLAYGAVAYATKHRHTGAHAPSMWGSPGGGAWGAAGLSGDQLIHGVGIAVIVALALAGARFAVRLRKTGRVSTPWLVVSALLAASRIALYVVAGRHLLSDWGLTSYDLGEILSVANTVCVALIGVACLLAFLGALLALFTVFTAISIFGVFLGTCAPIIALSVMSGFEIDLKTKIRATKADIVVSAAEDRPFTDWQAVQKRLAGIPDVVSSMAYVESEVIIKHATNPSGMGIILRGIDPASAPRVLNLGRTLREGQVEWLDHPAEIPTDQADVMRDLPFPDAPPGDKADDDAAGKAGKDELKPPPKDRAELARPHDVLPGILLGEELFAHTLRVYLGSDVDIACPLCGVGPTGPMPKLKSFRVAGHFYTGMYEFDSKLAYVSLADAQKFLGMQGEVTGIELRTRNPDAAPELAERLAHLLGPGYEVRSWEELNKALFMALRLEKIAMFVVLTFIVLVASFSIVSNLIMLVTEKAREVAILKSMGARDGAILRIFVAEGVYIGFIGLLLGLVVGIATCLLIAKRGLPLDPDVYYIQKLPVVMRGGEIAAICLAALGLSGLATLYPAFLASRLRPVEGLRYE
jgi:lipoprotein-releasing system permease protein